MHCEQYGVGNRACIGNVNRDIDITVWCRACIGNVNRDIDIVTDIGVWQLGVFSNTIPSICFELNRTSFTGKKNLLFTVATRIGHHQDKPL